MSERWLSEAKTPETRASIRRWYHWSQFLFWTGALCVAGIIAFIVVSIVAGRNHGPGFWLPLIGMAVTLIVCVGFSIHVDGLLIDARFADAEESVGVVEDVVFHRGSEGPDTSDIVIRSWVDGAMIRRKLSGMPGTSTIGDRVSFRHNTSDPEATDDIVFVGWRGHSRRSQPVEDAPRVRERFDGEYLSVGRVTAVTSLAGEDLYLLSIVIERRGQPVLHRRVEITDADLRTTGPAIRPRVLVGHRTWEPEESLDIVFQGWAKDAPGFTSGDSFRGSQQRPNGGE